MLYRILNAIGIALLLLLMAAGVFIYLSPHFGWQIENVRSGSMAPEIQRGTLVLAQPVEAKSIAVNDIVIVKQPGEKNLLCHRVIEIVNSPLQFRTKGDALKDPDPFLVPERDVVGKVFHNVPILGYPVMYMKTPMGFLMTMVIPGSVIMAMCLGSIRTEVRKSKKNAKQRGGNQ